jgi:hypothetical protein
MKRTVALFLILAPAAILAQGPPPGGFGPFGGRGLDVSGLRLGRVVTGAPYSAVQVVQTQTTLADGNRISNKRQALVYRDGQGRVRVEETVTPPADSGKQPFTMVTIIDPVAGSHYVLNTSTMTAKQSPLPPARTGGPPAGAPPRPPRGDTHGAQVAQASLGVQPVNGVAATGTQTTETIPAGAIGNAQPIQVVRVVWISNDLKVPVQIRSSDPRFGTTDMELTNVALAEPNPSLFIVPAGYTVQQSRGPMGPPGAVPNSRFRGGPPRE